MSRVESVYRVYAGTRGRSCNQCGGGLGWLLIKYQYRCLLPCTLAPGVSAALQRSWHSNIKKYNNRAPCAEAGWQQERSGPIPSAAPLLRILLESRLSQPSPRLDKYYIFMNL